MKEVMVFWGRNVYPQDAETTAWSSHPALKPNACAAFAVEEGGMEQLVVVQEIARPRSVDLDAVAEAIRQAVQSEHRVPLFALVLIKTGTLPKTSSGKLQRHRAREMFLEDELDVIRQWRFASALATAPDAERRDLPNQEDIQAWLVARIARQCRIAPAEIDPADPLTRYVMDSISAAAIAMELQQWLGRAIAPDLVLDSPSLALFSKRLADPQSYSQQAWSMPAAVHQLSETEVDQALAQLLGPGAGKPASKNDAASGPA
jgi:acyl carrier protein